MRQCTKRKNQKRVSIGYDHVIVLCDFLANKATGIIAIPRPMIGSYFLNIGNSHMDDPSPSHCAYQYVQDQKWLFGFYGMNHETWKHLKIHNNELWIVQCICEGFCCCSWMCTTDYLHNWARYAKKISGGFSRHKIHSSWWYICTYDISYLDLRLLGLIFCY